MDAADPLLGRTRSRDPRNFRKEGSTLTTKGLFTPRKSADTHDRYEMRLNDEDMSKVRRGRWTAEVTDQLTGRRYAARGAACSAPRCL